MAKSNKWKKGASKKATRKRFHESDANLRRFIAAYKGEAGDEQ